MNPSKYHIYCVADRMLFDTPERMSDDDSRFAEARKSAPAGWTRREKGLWIVLVPDGARLPKQGWKIHASATPGSAPDVIRTVWRYCVDNGVAFKFLRSSAAQTLTNSKMSPRGASGKLVAIYPENDEALANILTNLSPMLAGLPGSYILGDLRYEQGPLYVRYGAFGERFSVDDSGEPSFAIFAENGELVPDKRGAVFSVPAWVKVPDILQPSMRATAQATVTNFPYDIVEPLQFSNAGGVYLAIERATGSKVVLREARPYAGLDAVGDDAIIRLHRERDTLTRLAGLTCVPRLIDHRKVWEHEFLAVEHIEGRTLFDLIIERHPYTSTRPRPEVIAAYGTWLDEVIAKVADALKAIHQRGIRHGDLNPRNVIVKPDGGIVLIDFEVAAQIADSTTRGLRTEGFTAPGELSGTEADQYALECVRLWGRLPMTQVTGRDRRKVLPLIGVAEDLFAGDTSGAGSALATRWPMLTSHSPKPEPDDLTEAFVDLPATWPVIRDSMVAGILTSATPERDDRLFPGDPSQFGTGGISIRDGAAGVLLALHQIGVADLDEHVAWLARVSREPQRGAARAGLLTGRHGAAVVLSLLRHHEDAGSVLALAREHDEWIPAAGLLSGRAGVVISLLHFGVTGDDPKLIHEAARLGDDLVALTAGASKPGGIGQPATPGLLKGFSGVALALLHLYHHTNDGKYLDAAETALRKDLEQCETLPDDSIQMVDGGRYLAYLDAGSAGVALALKEYLRYRPDSELANSADGLHRALTGRMVFQPGLFQGRAGIMAALAASGREQDRPTLLRHAQDLGWHALTYQGALMFPGTWLQRLSADLGTGSAGILLALDAIFGSGTRPILPFLDSQAIVAGMSAS